MLFSSIFRAMIEEGGRPKLGYSSQTLGVRKNVDIDVDENGNVQRPDFTGKKNGVSCGPTVQDSPDFIRPEKFGGTNKRTKAWVIDVADLGEDLIAGQDGARHISIGPSREMSFDDFAAAVQATIQKWVEAR